MNKELRQISADSYLIGLIDRKCDENGLTRGEFCSGCGIKRSRYYERRKNPSAFTIGELREISRTLGFSEKDIAYIIDIGGSI